MPEKVARIANPRGIRSVIRSVSNEGALSDDWVRSRYGRAYRTAVLICGNPADAEEAVQDAFLRVWRFRDALPADEKREAWLYRVLVNACYSKLRREIPRRRREPLLLDGPATSDPPAAVVESPEHAAELSAMARALDSTLRDLPESLRVVVILRYFSELSEREIAVAIQRRPGTVKSRLHEARRRLAADVRLTAYGPDAEVAAP